MHTLHWFKRNGHEVLARRPFVIVVPKWDICTSICWRNIYLVSQNVSYIWYICHTFDIYTFDIYFECTLCWHTQSKNMVNMQLLYNSKTRQLCEITEDSCLPNYVCVLREPEALCVHMVCGLSMKTMVTLFDCLWDN